jgi:hypothetical protein
MSSREFAEWVQYYQLEPFGEPRADLRSGIVASTVANSARDPKKKPTPFKPDDFMIQFEQKQERQKDWRTMLAQVEMINKAFGGRDLRKQDEKGTNNRRAQAERPGPG